MYIFNGPYSVFNLMHHKILLNMGFGFARVQIKGIRISEGVHYLKQEYLEFFSTFYEYLASNMDCPSS